MNGEVKRLSQDPSARKVFESKSMLLTGPHINSEMLSIHPFT